MNHMKRLLAMLLALVMIVGVLPMSAFADQYGTAQGEFDIKGNAVDALVVFSDLHLTQSSSTNSSKFSTLQAVLNQFEAVVVSKNINITSVNSSGDMFSVNSSSYSTSTATLSDAIQTALPGVQENYVWSDHDRTASEISKESGFVYGFGADGKPNTEDDGNYYVYLLSMADLSSNDRYSAGFYSETEIKAHIATFEEDASLLDDSKPLFIVGHQPLYDRRDDNAHALKWVEAINRVASTMDVAYFHGHNHKYDVEGDYYHAKGSTMTVLSTDGKTYDVELNFTHINAGYLSPASTNSTSNTTREGTAIGIIIYDNAIEYVTYNQNGQYTGNYKLEESVARKAPQSLSVTGKIDYQVGDSIQDPTAVEVTYTNGAVSELTNGYSLTKITKDGTDYTVEGFTFPEAGTYTLTYTCTVGSYQAQAALTVTVAATVVEEEEEKEEEIKVPVVSGANVSEIKDVTSDVTVAIENVTNYVAYDITAELIGETAIVSIPVPSDWVVGELNAYYVDAEGNITDESFEVSYVDGFAVFTVTHFSTYVLTNTRATLDWKEISKAGTKDIFRLTDEFESGETYVIVNSNTAGSGNAVILNRSGYSYSIGSTTVTVIADSAGNYIVAPGAAAQWTFSSSSKLQNVGTTGRYLYASGSNAFGVTTSTGTNYTTWSYNTTNGLRAIKSASSSTYINCGNYYIYVADTLQTVAVYAAMEGQTSFDVHIGAYDEDIIHSAIAVYTATDASGTGKTPTNNYELVGTVNSGKVGVYTLSVQYGGKELGTITVNVNNDPYLKIAEDGVETELIYRKNVKVNDTVQLGVLAYDGQDDVANPNVTWQIPEEYAGKAAVDSTGKVTFLVDRANFLVKATWTVNGQELTDTIQIIITPDSYLTPGTSTQDFPEYPNQGAIRFDKTATAVGNFSETGVTQLELSMTGIPFSSPATLDVVLMLDRSSSMYKSGVQHRISSTILATKAFVENIVKNADGTFNNNRILVMDFLGGNLDSSQGGGSSHKYQSNTYTLNDQSGYEIISNQDELDALFDRIDSGFKGQTSLYGTEYAQGLQGCYDALAASKEDGNQQFCVFMSDGIPNYMMGETTHFKKTNDIVARFDVTNRTNENGTATRGSNYEYELYSTQMKNMGVTVFTVGLGLKNTNSAWSGTSKEVCEQVANILLNDIAGPAGETAAQRDTGNAVSKLNKYFFSVADDNAAEDMENVFTNIASQIMLAATDIVVTDKITNEYHMIFGIPQSAYNDENAKERNEAVQAALEGKDLYIEVINYALDAKHDRTGSFDELLRIYLKDSNGTAAGGTYSAAIDADGTAAEAPTFTVKEEGKKGYWSEFSGTAGENDIVITVGDKTWKFMEKGDGTHNVTAGAYASGKIHEKTNMSDDLVIVTPYFAYSAKTKVLAWTIDKVEKDKEIALRYFLYLDASSTEIGTTHETPAGTYDTNEWAYLTYTNHLGNECRQEFPKPQMTWNGAQVSYVFYLVNEAGQPINKAGTVVDFANAVFITDIFTDHVVWNDTDTPTHEGVAYLDATWMASDKLPEGYKLFDEEAYYELKVYEDHEGNVLDNYFEIRGSEANGSTSSTTKVYNTKAGERYSGYGIYTDKATDAYPNETVLENFDFANTTVAFAVVWKLQLYTDTVVVDFGLDVLVNVVANDLPANTLTGISKTERTGITLNTGIAGNSTFNSKQLVFENYVFSVEGENQIRFSQRNMQLNDSVTIYYETKSIDYINGTARTAYMYSSLTVIPATTIYYEDEYVTLKTYTDGYIEAGEVDEESFASGTYYTKNEDGTYTTATDFVDGVTYYIKGYAEDSGWSTAGTSINTTQQQDRPGKNQISEALDADNNYGYDAAYKNMSEYSMGSAAVTNVSAGKYATATFTFWGTGFDIISLTSAATGIITINVYKGSAATGEPCLSETVDTYYGYKKVVAEDGTVSWMATATDDSNALYQVPVMKIGDGKTTAALQYDQYTVVITATYIPFLDHNKSDTGYNFYLDAIRIYNPTGNNDKTSNDAYIADGEGWPSYFEIRDKIIEKNTFDNLNSETVSGIVFIDGGISAPSVSDYTNYGPNNEVYLDVSQAIAFKLNATATAGEVKKVQLAIKSVGGAGKVEVYGVDDTGKIIECISGTISTATDMYYDITALNGMNVVIKNAATAEDNGNKAIISVTNVKVTYTAEQTAVAEQTADTTESYLFSVSADSVAAALLSLRAEVEVEPEVPEIPEEPSKPETPEAPIKPEKPGKPSKPGNPTKPEKPGKPSKPGKPGQPAKPVNPGKPANPGKPVNPSKPAKPGMPVNPGQPVVPGRPNPAIAAQLF